MNITLLITGIYDPRWPIIINQAPQLPSQSDGRRILSPFEESVIELALKIRDAKAETKIKTIILGENHLEKIARLIAAYNISDIDCVKITNSWDNNAITFAVASLFNGDKPDLILCPREFGDCDEGIIPPLLAQAIGLPIFSWVQALCNDGQLSLERENGDYIEWVNIDCPLFASITNDRRLKLRKPLMKNVMMAKNAKFNHLEIAIPAESQIIEIREILNSRTNIDCNFLKGEIITQAQNLASILREVIA